VGVSAKWKYSFEFCHKLSIRYKVGAF
jgi:hypothetical protein